MILFATMHYGAPGERAAPAAAAGSGRSLAAGWTYEEVLRAYRTGDADKAVFALASWDERDVERVKRTAEDDEATKIQLGQGLALDARLRAVAALHLEAGIVGRDRLRFTLHVQIAEAAVRRLGERRSSASFCRTWYLAVAGYQVILGALSNAERMLNGARHLLGDAPELLLALGRVKETWSGPFGAGPPDYAGLGSRRWGFDVVEPTALLRAARDFYEKALAIDRNCGEARLRLGRVQQLLGHGEEALREFALCYALGMRPEVRYLAHLFSGAILERSKDLAGAVTAYRAAVEAMECGFAARVALARLLHSAGQADAASRTITEGLARRGASDEAADPWWLYQLGQLTTLASQLEELRAGARMPRAPASSTTRP